MNFDVILSRFQRFTAGNTDYTAATNSDQTETLRGSQAGGSAERTWGFSASAIRAVPDWRQQPRNDLRWRPVGSQLSRSR
jgi:hypothetical protein